MILATWILILIYMAVTVFLVIRGARSVKSMSDYAVGSVVFSPAFVGLSLAASMTSAATFIINPGFIAFYGFSAIISYALVLPAAAMVSLYFLTKGFRKHGQITKAQTMAQWMQTRYKSKGYGRFFAFLSLLLITFIVLIAVGLTVVLSKALAVDPIWVLAGIVIFIFGYMMFGGANSMVYTNTVQALIMLVVAVILLGSGYQHFSDGIHGFIAKLDAIDPNLTAGYNPTSFLFRDFFEIYIAQIIVGVAIVCQPHIITKSLLLKSDSDVNKYLTTGIIVQTLFFLVVITGLFARIDFPDLMINGQPLKLDGVMSAYVVREFPVWIGLFVILGLISAGISTLEGLIQSVSTTITTDIIKPIFGSRFPTDDQARHKAEITVNKGVIVGLAIITFLLSWNQLVNPNLSVGIFAQNGVYAYFSAAFLPIFMGLFLKNIPTAVPVSASVAAIIVHFSMFYGKLPVPGSQATGANPGVAAAVAILVSVAVAAIVWLLKTYRRDAENAE